jgi:hypothetical protein
MTKRKSLTAGIIIPCMAGIVFTLALISCTEKPTRLLLRVNYEPVGKVLKYSLALQRAGAAYKNDEFVKDIDKKLEAEITYTTKKIFPDGSAAVLEENKWSWDEVTDSGRVKRKSAEYAYDLRIAPNGRIIDFKMLGDICRPWENYARNYYEQGVPVFPDSTIQIGYSWTQNAKIELSDGDTTEVSAVYKVKGTTRKMGHNCAIIEYRGNLILPLFPDPDDSTAAWGVDRIEMNGILYFAHKEGISVSSEERRRVICERHTISDGKEIVKRSELEEAGSYRLTEAGGI